MTAERLERIGAVVPADHNEAVAAHRLAASNAKWERIRLGPRPIDQAAFYAARQTPTGAASGSSPVDNTDGPCKAQPGIS